MRSVLKLTGAVGILVLVPTFASRFFIGMDPNDAGMMVSQLIIVTAIMFVFLGTLRLIKIYEDKTLAMIEENKDNIEKLKEIRDERKSYKSKAEVTRAILIKEPSVTEAENLKKYTNQVKDMNHYYSALIGITDRKNRDEYKNKRNSFKKKYGHKKTIYPDFDGNLKTTIKWLVVFFAAVIITSLIGKAFDKTSSNYALYVLGQMILLASYMLNTILWISRTLKSYWDRDFI